MSASTRDFQAVLSQLEAFKQRLYLNLLLRGAILTGGLLLSFFASLSHLLFKQLPGKEGLLQFIRTQNILLAIALLINYIFTITKTFYLWL